MNNNLDLGLEKLEQRKMLAGDVSLDIDGGNVELRGENNTDHEIWIEASDMGFIVSGVDTTINGEEFVEIEGEIGNLEINLRSGNNTLILTKADEADFSLNGDLEVDTRGGSDIVIMDTLNVGGEVDINTRGGDDAVSWKGSVVKGDFDLRTGGGDDVFVVYGSDNEFGTSGQDDFDIRTGGGDDGIIVSRSTVYADANIRSGGGSDRVSLFEGTFNDEIDVRGGGSEDTYLEDAARPNVYNGDALDLRSIEVEDNSSFGAEFVFQTNDNATFDQLRDKLISTGIG